MKECPTCEVEKAENEFCKDKSKPDGLNMYCKTCAEVRRKKWRDNNRDRYNASAQRYRDNNREKVRAATRKWQQANRPEIKRYGRTQRVTKPELYLLKAAKERAARLGVTFTLDVSDITIPEVCPYLNIPLKIAEGHMNDNSPTLDRVDNTKGYIAGNILVVCWRANRIKADSTPDELRRIADSVEAFIGVRVGQIRSGCLREL